MRENLEKMYWAWETNVTEKLEDWCYNWKYNFAEKFVKDEEGDTNMVSIIVLIVIVIAIAGILRTQLTTIVNNVFGKLTTFINETK